MKQATRILAFVLALIPGMLSAYRLRFIQDDAYISWRYAQNLSRGIGLVWNEGERVEGYTNFLWTLALSIAHACNIDLQYFTLISGMILLSATLAVFYYMVKFLTSSWCAATFAVVTLGTFPSFAAYATGGLETALQTFLLTATSALMLSAVRAPYPSFGAMLGAGVTSSLAMLTRMDSLVIISVLLGSSGYFLLRMHGRKVIRELATLCAIPTAICGSWIIWKYVYYRSILPNTFKVKVDGLGGLSIQGLRFLWSFVFSYAFYLPCLLLIVGAWLALKQRIDRRIFLMIIGPFVLFLFYIIWVGGDFMEYRFLVPLLPNWFLVIYWVMSTIDSNRARTILLTSSVIAGSSLIYTVLGPRLPGAPVSVQALALTNKHEWVEVGEILGRSFAGSVRPKIAVTPAGAMPYLSKLPSVDMLGLNDPDVQNFIHFPDGPVGHRHLAPIDLLERRGVNFLIGHPWILPIRGPGSRYTFEDFSKRHFAYHNEYLLKGRQVIELPLSRDRVALIAYLIEDPSITGELDKLGWRHYPLE